MTISLVAPATIDDAVQVVESLQFHVHELSGSAASTQLQQLTVLCAKLDAYRVALVSAIRTSDIWRQADPNGTPASFLREQHVLDHREAKADLRSATSFDRFPELAQACREGRVSREKVDAILTIGLHNPARESALPEFIHIFVDLAERVPVSQLKRTLQLWADQVDPVTTSGDERDAHARRELHIHHLGDGIKLDGFFGPEQGMKIMAALNAALTAHRRDNPDAKDQARTDREHGEHGNYAIVSATATQRADALVDAIVTPALESGRLPTCGGAQPNVCVTVPLQRLQSPAASPDFTELKDRITDETLRLFSASIATTNGPGHQLLSTQAALRLSCDANVQRIVLSPQGKPLDIGRKTRVIPDHIRKALIIRDGGCRFPHCDKPAGWTEGHHIQHWSRGGSTSLDNLILLCSRHHHHVHAQQIPIKLDQTGKPRIMLDRTTSRPRR